MTHFANQLPLLSFSEKHVLYAIDADLAYAKGLPLTRLAEEQNVSTTTVVRMCKKLGFSGYSEFKYELKLLHTQESDERYHAITRLQADLQNTLNHLERYDVEAICEAMAKANRIVIVAVGLSKMFGEYFSKLLMQLNEMSMYMYESHMIDLLASRVSEGDVVIFISSSGQTQTLVKMADKLQHQPVQTIAITNNIDSPLTQYADHSLSSQVARVEYAGYDLTTRSSLVVLIDLLFESYVKRKFRKDNEMQ